MGASSSFWDPPSDVETRFRRQHKKTVIVKSEFCFFFGIKNNHNSAHLLLFPSNVVAYQCFSE